MQLSKLVNCDPEIMSGMLVFKGTRVPVKTLWDYLEGGSPLEVFLDDFPSVSRKKALGVLEWANKTIHHAHLAG